MSDPSEVSSYHKLRHATVCLVALLATGAAAALAGNDPDYRTAAHSQGNLQLTVHNNGSFAGVLRDPNTYDPIPHIDAITGDSVYGCIYPRESGVKFFDGIGLRFGGISGRDTLFSGRFEINPGPYPLGAFRAEGLDQSLGHYSDAARSELDLICEFTDTLTDPDFVRVDPYDRRYHIPMGLKITQRSMAWSSRMVDDFILIDYEVTNIGDKHLRRVFFGVNGQENVTHILSPQWGSLTGYLREYHQTDGCQLVDTLNVAYIMDNDGGPVDGEFTAYSPLGAVGFMLLGASADSLIVNYNWIVGMLWDPSWGPRQQGTPEDPFRSIGTGLGSGEGDANAYYELSHPEVDYDQLFCALDNSGKGWLRPPPLTQEIAAGWNPHLTLSFGPFDIGPGDQMNFTIAIVGGDNVHRSPTAFRSLFSPNNPVPFFGTLDFSELAENASWAKKVYDNPGVDTDGDGYAGEFEICNGDTVWTRGDGIPDFRANTPPPAPYLRIIPSMGKLVIRWNGFYSEHYIDPFSRIVDYEGYRVYVGLDNRRTSLSVLASYDRMNFKLYENILQGNGEYLWENNKPPFLLDSLRIIFNEPELDPLRYSRTRPLEYNGEYYFFEAVDYNMNDLSSQSGIHKVYPNATDPGIDTTLWTEDDITTEHGRALPKFYEYEYIYGGILPTVEYFVAVTAFDFGFSGGNIPSQESRPANNLRTAMAQTTADTVEAYHLDVYVYPNPYRVDANYRGSGYENREGKLIPNRARLIHFSNLPNVCDIYIYTIDGDLVRRIEHNYPQGGSTAMHHTWDLINRNVQAVESGLYYWVVESANRTQIGKLVIIK